MISLTDFVKSLPGVRPIKARKLILDGDILTSDERRDIFTERRGDFFVDCIGPDAAAAILAAYRTSRLPMDRGTSISDTPSAERYLENADALREQIADRRRKEAALKDISFVEERDFQDNRFLDTIFWKQFPKGGEATLVLAGIAVTKTVQSYPSNSGKSRGNEVTFYWTGSDGEKRFSGTGKPPEASNRRNDADRNWGLHE
ncbi:hypothetical protein WMC41_13465 [Shinella yambaruensis]|uniref:hypothetical protein n=1 Tax=Shinella yambaruensis TaxID=415996 RepID=UPI003D7A1B8E